MKYCFFLIIIFLNVIILPFTLLGQEPNRESSINVNRFSSLTDRLLEDCREFIDEDCITKTYGSDFDFDLSLELLKSEVQKANDSPEWSKWFEREGYDPDFHLGIEGITHFDTDYIFIRPIEIE